jgi:putative membrane protein
MNKRNIKRKKILTKTMVISIIMTLIVLIPSVVGFSSETGVQKNETIYVILDHNGKVKDERIVNRVWGTEENSEWIDYGDYLEISNMVSEVEPEVEEDRIIWPMDILRIGDLYYQGITDKDLPVEVTIRHYLNGIEIEGEELAGKSGDIKINIKIRNKLKRNETISYMGYSDTQKESDNEYYTPLLVQVSLTVDLDIFSNVSAEGASKVVTGSEMSIGFGTYPYPEEEFTIEMKGENIELKPINIIVIPQNLPFQDTDDTKEGLIEMADGLEDIGDNAYKVIDGLDEMLNKAGNLTEGIEQFIDAIAEINNGIYEIDKNSGSIGKGMEGLMSGLDTLSSESSRLASGINEIKTGTDTMDSAISGLAGGASDLSTNITLLHSGMAAFQTGHADLSILAEGILAAYPDTPENAQIRNLALGVISEKSAVDGFVSAIGMIDTGAVDLSAGLSGLSGNFSLYSIGIGEIASGTSALPEGLGKLADGMRSLYNGWEEYSNGISELNKGTNEFYNETVNFPEDVNELLDGIEKIRDAIKELTEKGIIKIEDGVIEGIDNIEFSEALEKKLDELAQSYNSFIDNDNNLDSEVQFIMQTEEIKIDRSSVSEELIEEEVNLTFFQKILSWFKK